MAVSVDQHPADEVSVIQIEPQRALAGTEMGDCHFAFCLNQRGHPNDLLPPVDVLP